MIMLPRRGCLPCNFNEGKTKSESAVGCFHPAIALAGPPTSHAFRPEPSKLAVLDDRVYRQPSRAKYESAAYKIDIRPNETQCFADPDSSNGYENNQHSNQWITNSLQN